MPNFGDSKGEDRIEMPVGQRCNLYKWDKISNSLRQQSIKGAISRDLFSTNHI